MADERLKRDPNRAWVMGGVSNDASLEVIQARFDPTTKRLLVTIDGPDLLSDGDAVAAGTNGTLVLGSDGSNYQAILTDASGHLQVDVLSGGGGSGITGIAHGVKVVTTAGTDVVLAASTTCKKVVIQAQTDNTGLIAVGGSGVDATEATGTGVILYPGDVFELDIDNLNDVYIDSTVNGEGVRFTYFT